MNKVSISRLDNWFQFVDAELDPYIICFKLMDALSTRLKIGLEYNRLDLIKDIASRSSGEALTSLDQSIMILRSKDLIRFEKETPIKIKLFLTDYGLTKHNELKELLNEN